MLKLIIKSYIKHKLNDIHAAEIRSMTDESYESPYFQDEMWRKAAWDIHCQVKDAYDRAVKKVYNIIDEMDLTDEQREKAYQIITVEPYCNDEGKLCVNIKTLNN